MRTLAFSLIELMVVVAVVGILSVVATPAYKGYMQKAELSRLVTMFQHYSDFIIEYHSVHGEFPTTTTVQAGSEDFGTGGWIYHVDSSTNLQLADQFPGASGFFYAYDNEQNWFYLDALIANDFTGESGIDGHAFYWTAILNSDVFNIKCGSWATSPGDPDWIQPEFLPPGCNQADVKLFD